MTTERGRVHLARKHEKEYIDVVNHDDKVWIMSYLTGKENMLQYE